MALWKNIQTKTGQNSNAEKQAAKVSGAESSTNRKTKSLHTTRDKKRLLSRSVMLKLAMSVTSQSDDGFAWDSTSAGLSNFTPQPTLGPARWDSRTRGLKQFAVQEGWPWRPVERQTVGTQTARSRLTHRRRRPAVRSVRATH